MKKTSTFICLITVLQFSSPNLFAQTSLYNFASFSGTYSSIVGGGGTAVIATTADDENFGTFPVGFTFNYNGNPYTTFGLNANGFITMGYVPVTTNNALSSGVNNNVISAFNNDLKGTATGAQISYQTSGSGVSHVLTVEWTNWGFYSSGGANEFNLQIKLFESTNNIQIVYGSCPGNTSSTLQVGLRGETSADFNNRTTLTDWSATIAGSTHSVTCTYNSTVKPLSGLTFQWTPTAAARVCGTITAIQQTGGAAPGSTSNGIIQVDIPVTGNTGNLTLSSITVVSKNTTDNDISSGGVKIWTGTSSGPVTQLGSGASFSGGSATISSINTNLLSGTNYIWITFDVKIAAIVGDVLDVKVNAGAISISASGGATNPGMQPATVLNPSGNKTVNYCTPPNTYGGCDGDQIQGFAFAGVSYTAGNCLTSPGYLDVGTTGASTQGQPINFTLTLEDMSDYGNIWIDFNDNASFDDAGELVYSGSGFSQTGSIFIPVSAPAGTHRVRVRDNFGSAPPSSCGGVTFGETKDFRLLVNAASNCAGSPVASNTVSSVNPICSGVNFTLSLDAIYLDLGITYQWQSSLNGTSYSNISGATGYSYTTSQAASVYYRCLISCTYSGQSIFTGPLLENMNPFSNCYCTPSGDDCTDDKITSVIFGGINNSSTCSANGYGDYTTLTGTTNEGASQSISVGALDPNSGTEYVSVWIDYNHNAVFDASERTFIGSGFNQTISSSIQIPGSALTGVTHMRVRLENALEPTDPCGPLDLGGETEDYSVNINPCTISSTFYADADGDTYGNPNVAVLACSPPNNYVTNHTDCNDNNAAVHPNATEICNSIDDNCNGQIDEGLNSTYYADADADTYGNPNSSMIACSTPSGFVNNNTDCNDANAAVHPNAIEVCNGIDDNCNGTIDEGCAAYTYYADADNDGYGNPNSSISSNSPTPPAGYVANNTDCNDANAAVHPGVADICNGIDDNCNGSIDENAITATVSPSGSVSVCKGTTLTLTANSGTGLTYQWLKSGANVSGATHQTYSPTKNGSYSVKETNSFSCSSISAATSVTIVSAPTATITAPNGTDLCSTGSVLLQANSGSGYTYQWKKGSSNLAGATNQNYTATVAATYKVIVTSSNGCSKTSGGKKVTKSCKENSFTDDNTPALLSLYPNPSDGSFVITLQLQNIREPNATLEILNTLGQIILKQEIPVTDGALKQTIQLGDNLSAGMYLVKVIADNQIYASQLMINR